QAEDGIRDFHVTGVQTCALPIFTGRAERAEGTIDLVAAGTDEPGPFGLAVRLVRAVPLARVEQPAIDERAHVRRENLILVIRAKIGRASCRERAQSRAGAETRRR